MTTKQKAQELAFQSLTHRKTEFIRVATEIHNGLYDYSHVDYINQVTKVEIGCKTHGLFSQKPNAHTSAKAGCPHCAHDRKLAQGKARRLTNEEFIDRSKAIYGDKFEYTNTRYVSGNKPVSINCKSHGEFTIARAEKHLYLTQACPVCCAKMSIPERLICDKLDSMNIEYTKEYTVDGLVSPSSGRPLRFDFFIPSHNMIIEFHGEQHFKQSSLMHPGDRFERMQQHDSIKESYAKKHNIRFEVITYKQIKDLDKIVTDLIIS